MRLDLKDKGELRSIVHNLKAYRRGWGDGLVSKYLLHTHGYLSQNPVKAGEAEDSGAYWSGEWVSSRSIEGPCLKS